MTYKTNREVAEDFGLWMEYFDTEATMTEEEFDAMSVDEREKMIEEAFGADERQAEQRGD